MRILVGLAWSLASAALAAPLEPAQDAAVRDRLHLSAYGVTAVDVFADAPDRVELGIATSRGPAALVLHLAPVRSRGFELLERDAQGVRRIAPPAQRTYRGEAFLPGQAAARVSASWSGGELRALIFGAGRGGMIAVQPLRDADRGASAGVHVVYEADDVLPLDMRCGCGPLVVSKALGANGGPGAHHPPEGSPGSAAAGGSLKLCEIAFEADTFYSDSLGGSAAAIQSDVDNILNGMIDIYEHEVGITYEMTALVMQSGVNDLYPGTDSTDLLEEFTDYWNDHHDGIQRDVAHLFTGRDVDGNVIGRAWVGVICSAAFGYGYSETTYSGNLALRTALACHEVGHNWNADHCNGKSDCSIMCATIGGCSGDVDSFGESEQQQIEDYAKTVPCLENTIAAAVPPFLDTFPTTKLDKRFWTKFGGAKIVPDAKAETSGSLALVLDAAKDGTPDELTSNVIDFTGLSGLELSFFHAHRGVEAGEQLAIDWLDSGLAWQPLATLSSDGVDQPTFERFAVPLPPGALHPMGGIRFRALVDQPNDDWFLDDVQVAAIAAPPGPMLDGAGAHALVFDHVTGGPAPAGQSIEVINRGAAQPLSWTATDDSAHLSLLPTSGVLTTLEGSDTIVATADPTLAPLGLTRMHATVHDDSFGEDPMQSPAALFELDAPRFTPGDTLVGTLASAAFSDAWFFALEDETIAFTVSATSGDLKPTLTLFDEQGGLLAALKLKHSTTGDTKSFTVPSDGLFRVRVEGREATSGDFLIATPPSLPAAAKASSKKLAPPAPGGLLVRDFACLPGATVDVTVAHLKSDKPDLTLQILDVAEAATVPVGPFFERLPTGGGILHAMPLNPGRYQLRVSGFAGSESVRVTILPHQPAGTSIIALP